MVVELLVSDADGDAVTLSIASGDLISDRKFQLVDKSIQTTSSAIDYESLTSQGYKYTLTVTATDGIYTGTATVYVTVSYRHLPNQISCDLMSCRDVTSVL